LFYPFLQVKECPPRMKRIDKVSFLQPREDLQKFKIITDPQLILTNTAKEIPY